MLHSYLPVSAPQLWFVWRISSYVYATYTIGFSNDYASGPALYLVVPMVVTEMFTDTNQSS